MLHDEIGVRLRDMRLDVSDKQLDALVLHAELVLEANATLNLTRITDARAVAVLHVADSLTALPFLATAPPGPFADLGSGAGYPGIPLAVMSGRPVTLVEAKKKKAVFLQTVIEAAELDAKAQAIRAEELAVSGAAAFSAVVARAVAPLPSLVELASPLLRRGGLLIAMKGRPDDCEMAAGDVAAAIVGLGPGRTIAVTLPGDRSGRRMVVYTKMSDPRIRLPRRPGLAQRSPLA